MKIFERLSCEEDWDIDAQLSITGSLASPDISGDIPAEGWPNTYKPEVVDRMLSYLVEVEEQ